MITSTYKLGDINQGYQDMRDGKNIRGVLVYDAERRPAQAAALAAAPPAQMSLQRSQTSSGTTPARMSTAKALQPRQRPKADSKRAATRQQAQDDLGGGPVAEAGQHERGQREGDTHALGEALGRARHRALRATPAGG